MTTRDSRGDPHLPRAVYRPTEIGAVAGVGTWLALAAAGALPAVALFVAFALLVAFPLGMGVVATQCRVDGESTTYRVAALGQFPAALLAVEALRLPTGSAGAVALALPWVGVTGCAAAIGLQRLFRHGVAPLPELAIDAALLYVPVGAIALVTHRAGVSLGFAPIVLLLTVVHYHYAGFVLPLVAGAAGRIVADERGRFGSSVVGRATAAATLVIVVNLALIAVGITFSPLVELVAVAFFAAAVVTFAFVVLGRVAPRVGSARRILLSIAAIAVLWTMALALGYGYSAYPGTRELVSLGDMVILHGSVNAFGFALPALLAFHPRLTG